MSRWGTSGDGLSAQVCAKPRWVIYVRMVQYCSAEKRGYDMAISEAAARRWVVLSRTSGVSARRGGK